MKIEKIYKALPTNKDCIKLLEIGIAKIFKDEVEHEK